MQRDTINFKTGKTSIILTLLSKNSSLNKRQSAQKNCLPWAGQYFLARGKQISITFAKFPGAPWWLLCR